MKKTFNINVAGFPFIIDDDAYTLLNDYLDTIEHAFSRLEDSTELINDIENRVAELLLEHTSAGSPIVTLANVQEVIKRIGQPEEMIEADENISIDISEDGENVTASTTESATPPPYNPPLPPVKKKLFRDPQNAMLGGVCSGIAAYLNCDATVARLLVVFLSFISFGVVSVAYIILWIIIPEARTPIQRLQMEGKQPTMENIGQTVTNNFREDSSQPFNNISTNNFGDVLASFFGICARVLVIIGLVIAFPLLFILVLGLLGCVFTLIMYGTSLGASFFGDMMPRWYNDLGSLPIWSILCAIGGILTIGIPIYILLRKGLSKDYTMSKFTRNSFLCIWIMGFILAAVSGGRIFNLIAYNEQQHKMEHRLLTSSNPIERKFIEIKSKLADKSDDREITKRREAKEKRKEAKLKRKEAKEKRKEAELKRKEAKVKRREAELKRKEINNKRQIAELKKKTAKANRKEEVLKRKEANVKRKEADLKRRQTGGKRQVADSKRSNGASVKNKGTELKSKKTTVKHQEPNLKRTETENKPLNDKEKPADAKITLKEAIAMQPDTGKSAEKVITASVADSVSVKLPVDSYKELIILRKTINK